MDGCYWNLSSQLLGFQEVVFDNSTVTLYLEIISNQILIVDSPSYD